MMNKFPGILVVIAMLFGAFPGEHSAFAKDEVAISGDSTTMSLSKNYTILEVRQAIERVREGNYAEAVPILQKYAANRDIGATYVLGKLYVHGLGVEASTLAATKLFTANAEDGHTPSMMALAQINQKTRPGISLYMIKQAATAGDLFALTELGKVYEKGILGVQQNPRQAFNYYQEASNSGNPLGDYHLGRFYDQGIGVSANEVESTRFYRKAALGGIVDANAMMAKRYFEGKGLDSDPIAAIGWLTRGAQNGSTESMVVLGERYEMGDTLKQDLNRAGQLFSQAAKMGNPAGAYKLAMMYQNGTGTKADPVRAYVLLSGAQTLPKAQAAMTELKSRLTLKQMEEAQKQIDAITQNAATKSGN